MKKKIINGILAASILVAAPSAFVSCKDNDADVRTELLGKIAELKNQLDNIQLKAGPQGEKGDTGAAGKDGQNGKDGSVVTIGSNGNWFIDGVDTGVPTQVKGETGEKGEDGHTPVITIGENGNWFVDGKDTGVSALGTKGEKGDKGDMASVLTIGENGNWFIDGVDTNVPARGEKGEKGDKGEQGTIGSIVSIGENGNWFIDGVDTNVPARGEDGVTPILVQDPTDGHWYWWIKGQYQGVRADGIDGTGIGGSTFVIGEGGTWIIDGVDTKIVALTYDQLVKLIKDQIYNAERDGLTPELEDQIKKLLNSLDNSLTKSIKDMITDVIVERTENPFYGQMAIPGWNPLVVSAYFGQMKNMVFFPEDDINITNVEQKILDGGDVVMSDAGKILLTINPNEASVAGKLVSLETSQGNAAPFTVGALSESNEEITFGWNHTRGANGLYEAPVTLTNPTAAGVNIQKDILKDDAKTILNDIKAGNSKTVVTSMAKMMADAFSGAIETIPAYTVKVTWGDPLFGTRTVRSGYEIAAFSVNPLPYDFEYTLSAGSSIVDRIFDKLAYIKNDIINSVKFEFDFGLEKIEELYIKNIDLVGHKATVHVKAYPLNNSSTTPIEKDVTFKTTKRMEKAIKEAMEIAGDVQTVNDLIKKYLNLENDINGQVASAKTTVKGKIQDYLDEYHARVNKIFGASFNLNSLVRPTLLVNDSKGVHHAFGTFEGTIKLMPTSYSAEIFAPAYKKFIVITEVDGNPATAADNVGQLGQILDGGVQQIEFKPASGKTYTIAYSALDYFGNIVTNYYLISGK